MSVIPQQPRPTTADGVYTSVLMTFRVLESGVDGTLAEHAISITAHADGLIEALDHRGARVLPIRNAALAGHEQGGEGQAGRLAPRSPRLGLGLGLG